MKILSIETSCDETAVSIVEATGGVQSPSFRVLGNALNSQIAIHSEYGGVFPMLAKREHAKNLPILLKDVLIQANEYKEKKTETSEEMWQKIENILTKEIGLYENIKNIFSTIEKPDIDMIAVTSGPGLTPALWVGISCAQALGVLWDIHVMPINHMEGHIVSVLMENEDVRPVEFPALALLISGGHTEIVSIKAWGSYTVIGQTRDDAVGEAFDKVARMLGLPYPGGPEISQLAKMAREKNIPHTVTLPRPMLHSQDLDFSFSGLKTAVLYHIRDNGTPTEEEKMDIAREFEDAVTEVLIKKTEKALEDTGAKILIVAGGVIANTNIREACKHMEKKYTGLVVKTPTQKLSTDNALMIAGAAYIESEIKPFHKKNITAVGNLKLS